MTIHTRLLAAIAALSITSAASVNAAPLNMEREGHRQGEKTHFLLKERVANKLELSSEQQTQIKNIFNNAKKARSAEFTQLKDLKAQWRELAKQPVLNEKALTDIANQQADIKALLKVERLKTQKEVLAVLTEEQQAKVAAIQEKRKKKMKRKMKSKRFQKTENQSR